MTKETSHRVVLNFINQEMVSRCRQACGVANMSAMHWEARRRQQVLNRRLSASVKQVPMLTTCNITFFYK